MHRVLRLLLTPLVIVACGTPLAPASEPLAGDYLIGGGDSALPNVRALADAFAAMHPGVKFRYDSTLGSGSGKKLTLNGTLDLGMSSLELTAAEAESLSAVVIGVAGTGLAVHQGNPVRDLSREQVRAIYSGTMTDWSALGGAKVAIVPLMRESDAAARTSFEEYFFGGKVTYGARVLEIANGDQMRKTIAGQTGGVGLIGVHPGAAPDLGIHVVSIDGVAPTKEALRNGAYKPSRRLYLLSRRSPRPKAAIAQFLEFTQSAEGQAIIDRF